MPLGDRFIPYQTIIRQAIVDRQSLTAIYDNYVRHFSPHILGRDERRLPVILAFQYGGGRPGGLPHAGDWCLFQLNGLKSLSHNRDPWAAGPPADKPTHLMTEIDVAA